MNPYPWEAGTGLRPRIRLLLLAVVLPGLGLAAEGPAADWQAVPGGRFRELAVSSEGQPGFTHLSAAAIGLDFTNILSDAQAAGNQIRLNGSGVALGDVDGDGSCDVYLCGLENENALYRNLGGWRFTNVTAQAGVGCPGQYSTGATLVDVDGDGDLDLLVNGIGVGTRLFLNDGHGAFTEKADGGLSRTYGPTTSALADIDGDADLDLYVANYRTTTIRTTGFVLLNVGGKRFLRPEDRDQLEYTPDGRILEHGEPHFLYRNEGGGRFVPVPWTGGDFLDEDGRPLAQTPRDWGLSAMFRDLNGDRAPDLYVCNDFHSVDRIWINDGRGRFRAIDRLALRNTTTFSMCVDVADINRDGYDDIFESDMLDPDHQRRMMQVPTMVPAQNLVGVIDDRPQLTRNVMQLNRGDGTYAEIACFAGLEASGWTWSAAFLDVDLDGYEDLILACGHRFDTQDLDTNERIRAMGPFPREKTPLKILMYPRLDLPNAAFRNGGGRVFHDARRPWRLDEPGVRQGMALADLDHDGDLDIVQNALSSEPWVYRNDSPAPRVAVRLKGRAPNTRGIGAKVWLHGGAVPRQSQEIISGGRYLSCDDATRVFAAGSRTNAMRLEVVWRSGRRSVLPDVKANCLYEVDESAAADRAPLPPIPSEPVFEEVPTFQHTHHEELFDDFARQPLLPKRLSQLGPGVGWCDVDGDSLEDLVVGSGKGGRLSVLRNHGDGKFQLLDSSALRQTVTRDQTGILGWRDPAGNFVLLAGSANYEDGLASGPCVSPYNLSAGAVDDSFPSAEASTGPLAMADVDADGDLDLFVGGRVLPGRYPVAAASLLFRNDGGRFVRDAEANRVLERVGLVSGAVFSDLDGDGLPELILACEWGPLRVLRNDSGQLRPWNPPVRSSDPASQNSQPATLEELTGWWNGVTTGDLDGDGLPDIVASNWGLNTQYRASAEHPRLLYYGDLNDDGRVDLVEAYFDPGLRREVPERDLAVVSMALPFVRERIPSHQAYGAASVLDIFGDRLKQAGRVAVNTLSSMMFLNRRGYFEAVPLPSEAQLAPAFAVCVADVDGDGNEDVFLSQNFFATQPDASRSDAGRGLWLRGIGRGGLVAMPGQESGIRVYGEQRGAAVCDFDCDGRVDLVVAQNGARTVLYRNARGHPGLRVRLAGPPANPAGVGAGVRLLNLERQGPLRELHAGSGYWSCDSPVQVMSFTGEPTRIEVRWPGGKRSTADLPSGAKEIIVRWEGDLEVVR